MRIGIDGMGGDHAPQEPVKGAVDALKLVEGTIVIYGDEAKISSELAKHDYDKSRIEIKATTEVIENDDKPVLAIRKKKDSSMVVGLLDLKEKTLDAFVSGGNTGALLTGGLLKVGRIKGIDRPALCSIYPVPTGVAVMADVGANAECKPRNLSEFSVMASLYAEHVIGIPNPRVGLANIGVEETKGTPLVQAAHSLIKEQPVNYIGFIEARDIPLGGADVIVTDGFTGNMMLKLSEGVIKSFSTLLKEAIMSSFVGKLGGLMIKGGMTKLKKKMDYTEYGGAPLLGVKGLVVKAHGSSNAKAFMNAIKFAERSAKNEVVEKIQAVLATKTEE